MQAYLALNTAAVCYEYHPQPSHSPHATYSHNRKQIMHAKLQHTALCMQIITLLCKVCYTVNKHATR